MPQYSLHFILALSSLVLLLSSAQAGRWPEDCGNNATHNFYFGNRLNYDRLLYTVNENKSSSLLRKQSYDLLIPPYGQLNGTITFIEALDQRYDGTGGCVYLNGGGPGHRHVVLHLKSQRNHGINFIINVYVA